MKNNKSNRLFIFMLALIFISPIIAQEHPEHPDQTVKKTTTPITKNNLAGAIIRYVKSKSDGNMRFVVEDEEKGEELQLKLLKVHKDRLSHVGSDTYFACADFKDKDGKVYDLDVFMHGKTKEDLVFRKFQVHKEEGVARYGWKEENGVWKRILPKVETKE